MTERIRTQFHVIGRGVAGMHLAERVSVLCGRRWLRCWRRGPARGLGPDPGGNLSRWPRPPPI